MDRDDRHRVGINDLDAFVSVHYGSIFKPSRWKKKILKTPKFLRRNLDCSIRKVYYKRIRIRLFSF